MHRVLLDLPRRWGRRLAALPRRRAVLAGVLLCLTATVAGTVVAGGIVGQETLDRGDWTGTASGVFRETSPAEVQAFEDWLGRPVDLVADFSARATWYDISSPDYLLDAWRGSGHRLVLAVAMLPTDVPDVSIQEGARGAYDHWYRTLAEHLVAKGAADAVLRIGWEFNAADSRWATPDEQAWISYFRHIVDAVRSVPGQHLRIDWNVNNGINPHDAVRYWPGDAYVDYVGVDLYDLWGPSGSEQTTAACTGDCVERRSREAWDADIYGGERGLRFWSTFAAQHDKQLSLPEWGAWENLDGGDDVVQGGGDDPYFIDRMADFIQDPDNRVGYQAYFEYAGVRVTHRLMTDLPMAGERYRDRFGGSG